MNDFNFREITEDFLKAAEIEAQNSILVGGSNYEFPLLPLCPLCKTRHYNITIEGKEVNICPLESKK